MGTSEREKRKSAGRELRRLEDAPAFEDLGEHLERVSKQKGSQREILPARSPWEPDKAEARNEGNYEQMSPAIRRRPKMFFDPYNRKLYDLLGTNFDW